MRLKPSSAARLFCFLSFLYFGPSSSVEFPTALTKSRVQESQGGRDRSSKSHKRMEKVLKFKALKECAPNMSSLTEDAYEFFEDNEGIDREHYDFNKTLCQELKPTDGSVWIINASTLKTLDNDPQELIRCTYSGDRVAFNLTGMHKFKRTLEMVRPLQFFAGPLESKEVGNDTIQTATFTCPDTGPFLKIKSDGFNASGFVIQNCTNSSGEAAIVVQSKSKVMFERIELINNQRRAIFVDSKANLTLESCEFDGNGVRGYDGGAILARNNVSLLIVSSSFNENIANNGGAISGNDNITLTILFSIFSRNNARNEGGAIFIHNNINLSLTNTTLLGNNAGSFGGAISGYNNITLTIINTNLVGNNATNGGAILLGDNNNVTIITTNLTRNNARNGGAICLYDNNSVTIVKTALTWNNAASGGGIWVQTNNIIRIKNTKLLENNASEFGGAMLFADHNIVFLINCTVLINTAKWHGGALKLGPHCIVHLEHCRMQGNLANSGGSIYLERNVTMTILNSNYSNNGALRGGVIYANMDCDVSIKKSKIVCNLANFGGCFYGQSLSTSVKDSKLWNNSASQSGGCFYIDSSNAYVESNLVALNKRKVEGGAIYATSGTLLKINASTFTSNSAFNGGGIVLASNSRMLCYKCTLENNTADHGGAVYIESQIRHIVIAQFANSLFRHNIAHQYGGGMVIKAFGIRSYNCTNIVEPCNRVLLLNTTFVGNNASLSGLTILATKPDSILVACEDWEELDLYSKFLRFDFIQATLSLDMLRAINGPLSPCETWKGNRLAGDVDERVIGTFGQQINITIDSLYGPQINGSAKFGFVLHDVNISKEFPILTIKTIDAFGYSPAPALLETDALVLNSSSKILQNSVAFSFQNATCNISSIFTHTYKGNHAIEIGTKEEDVLENTTLTISITKCGTIVEQINSYEIEGCAPCPSTTSCNDSFVVPKAGYWQRSPCHVKVQECIVKKACETHNRDQELIDMIQEFAYCNVNQTMWSKYCNVQCHEGYEGVLCGSCDKSYGLSSSFECLKCGSVILSISTLIGIVCYLLVGTSIAIKGVLPLHSTQHINEDLKTTLLEENSSTLETISSIQPSEKQEVLQVQWNNSNTKLRLPKEK